MGIWGCGVVWWGKDSYGKLEGTQTLLLMLIFRAFLKATGMVSLENRKANRIINGTRGPTLWVLGVLFFRKG